MIDLIYPEQGNNTKILCPFPDKSIVGIEGIAGDGEFVNSDPDGTDTILPEETDVLYNISMTYSILKPSLDNGYMDFIIHGINGNYTMRTNIGVSGVGGTSQRVTLNSIIFSNMFLLGLDISHFQLSGDVFNYWYYGYKLQLTDLIT